MIRSRNELKYVLKEDEKKYFKNKKEKINYSYYQTMII